MWGKRMIWIGGILIAIVLVLFILPRLTNPGVAQEVRAEPQGPRAAKVMLMDLPSGKMLPVNYLFEPPLVFAGADGPWWREFRDGDVLTTLVIKGKTLQATARVVTDNQAYVDDTFARLRPKAPSWLPNWANGKLVVFEVLPGQDMPEPNSGAHTE